LHYFEKYYILANINKEVIFKLRELLVFGRESGLIEKLISGRKATLINKIEIYL